MNAVRCLTLALACALPVWPLTGQAGHLPDPQAAQAALQAAPAVAQARGELAAQTYRSEGLGRGTAEWSVTADALQRRVDVPRDRYAEWGLAVSRPLRMPARAEADRALGAARLAHAEASLGEALHESGRQLLALWFDWLAEAGQSDVWRTQVELAERQLDAVNARIRLGEAARAERVSAEAALANVRLQAQQAAARLRQAAARLRAQYPTLAPALDEALPQPAAPAGAAPDYVEAVLAHSHENLRARRQAEMLGAEARQYARRRSVDPNLGVFYKNETGGSEHVLGVSLGLTLPGPARRSEQQAAEALRDTANDAAARLEARLRAEAEANFEAATALAANWRQAEQAALALEESARLAARAYALGEGGLDAVLTARRLAQEGRLQERQTRVAALAADARLKLDAHALWPLDADADGAHVHP